MKNLTLINNEWKQRVAVELTEEERELLETFSDDRHEERTALAERIHSESLIAADTEDAAAAQALYDQHKIEGADLIAADITLPEGTGIINCRLNGEHKQIRF
jgi:DNA-binding response OmpR family regulator